MSISRNDLHLYLKELLIIDQYRDYGPNGLQVEGKHQIKKIGLAVSATYDSIQAAVKGNVDALIVHHGLFWKFHGPKTITGPFANRIKPLIQNDISLYGYHLPLDAHPEFGNAAYIAKKLGMVNIKPFGNHKGMPTGLKGDLPNNPEASFLSKDLEKILSHQILHSNPHNRPIQNLGIITGGANSDWVHALNDGLDSYLTGEMSEHDWHEAKESGVHMFAGGHNSTERGGVIQLGDHLKEKFQVEVQFFESDNPA